MTLEELKAEVETLKANGIAQEARITELEKAVTSPRDDHAHDKVERIAKALAHVISFLTPWGFSVGAAEEPTKDDAA